MSDISRYIGATVGLVLQLSKSHLIISQLQRKVGTTETYPGAQDRFNFPSEG